MKVRDTDANGGLPAAASPGRSAATMVSRQQSGQYTGRLLIASTGTDPGVPSAHVKVRDIGVALSESMVTWFGWFAVACALIIRGSRRFA